MSKANYDNIWELFLYKYFNGWFILIMVLVIIYFIFLRKKYVAQGFQNPDPTNTTITSTNNSIPTQTMDPERKKQVNEIIKQATQLQKNMKNMNNKNNKNKKPKITENPEILLEEGYARIAAKREEVLDKGEQEYDDGETMKEANQMRKEEDAELQELIDEETPNINYRSVEEPLEELFQNNPIQQEMDTQKRIKQCIYDTINDLKELVESSDSVKMNNTTIRKQMRSILKNRADKLYSELPQTTNGKKLQKDKILLMLQRKVPQTLYNNWMPSQATYERQLKLMNEIRTRFANYGPASDMEVNQYKSVKNTIFNLDKEAYLNRRILQLFGKDELATYITNKMEKFADMKISNNNTATTLAKKIKLDQIDPLTIQRDAKVGHDVDLIAPGYVNGQKNKPFVYNNVAEGFYLDEIEKKEQDLAQQYGSAYQKYVDELKKEELSINPLKLLSKFETNAVNFLAEINPATPSIPSPPSLSIARQEIVESMDPDNSRLKNLVNTSRLINPVNFETNTMGNYLLDPATQSKLVEGFQTTDTEPTKIQTGSTDNMIGGLLNFIYDKFTGLTNLTSDQSPVMENTKKILENNDNVMTIGILFIIGSIMLLLIEFTS